MMVIQLDMAHPLWRHHRSALSSGGPFLFPARRQAEEDAAARFWQELDVTRGFQAIVRESIAAAAMPPLKGSVSLARFSA